MIIKLLLAMAAECKSQSEADNLLATLQSAIISDGPLSHLRPMNGEAMMEEPTPYVSFELSQVMGDRFITTITPEVRDGKFVVAVVTNRVLVGAGLSAHSWEAVEGTEHLIEPSENDDIQAAAARAKDVAIANHARLIEDLGVPSSVAMETAARSWLPS